MKSFKLACITVIICSNSIHVQSQTEKIEVVNLSLGKAYMYKGQRLKTMADYGNVFLNVDDSNVNDHFSKAKSLNSTAMPFALVGGGLIGWELGSLLYSNDETDSGIMKFDSTVLIVGCVAAVIGVAIGSASQKSLKKAINRYNEIIGPTGVFSFQHLPRSRGLGIQYTFSLR